MPASVIRYAHGYFAGSYYLHRLSRGKVRESTGISQVYAVACSQVKGAYCR